MAGRNRDRDETRGDHPQDRKLNRPHRALYDIASCTRPRASLRPEKVNRLRASHRSDGTVEVPAGQITDQEAHRRRSADRSLEEEQTFQPFGFEQDLVRNPLTFALQVLEPVDGAHDIPV
jgi:hypothetical protein